MSMQMTGDRQANWLDQPLFTQAKTGAIALRWPLVILAVILLFAVGTRFYDLDSRVMSHDESLHTYYSWQLFKGRGYVHDPMMHGPFQFHVVALSYFLFGDSDASARVPVVLFSIASVAFIWSYRRYLGRVGALVAAGLFVISPYMLYYGRYVRNESFVAFFSLVTLWAILRYLESGKARYLLWLTAATVLHFATKETSFIYTAQALVFLGLLFLNNIMARPWGSRLYRNLFLILLVVAAILLGGALYFHMEGITGTPLTPGGVMQPAVPGETPLDGASLQTPSSLMIVPAALGVVALLLALFFLVRGYGLSNVRQEHSFELIVLIGTLILPHLSPFPVSFMGWFVPDTPGAIQTMTTSDILHFTIFLVPLTLLAIAIGLWWNARLWLINAGLFYGIFTFLYTTMFSNPNGFLSGLIGSLGYWMAQQEVARGSQPWYYYLLVQLPVYEYLPLLGSLLAGAILIRRRFFKPLPPPETQTPKAAGQHLALNLLVYWSITSFLAYTIAGEKMPWLTVHIALPLILLGGWGIGELVKAIPWREWRLRNGWGLLVAIAVFLFSFFSVLGALFGDNPPFRSKELVDLQNTGRFFTSLLFLGGSSYAIYRVRGDWSWGLVARLGVLTTLGLAALLTLRTSIQANYVNYDQANEYLVYAHSAVGVKDVLSQVEEISIRTTDGLAVGVGYDNDTSWPMTWYLRNFTGSRYYGANPGRDLRDLPLIIVGDDNFGKIEPVVGQAYLRFDYIRMVWPNQDYFGLNWTRIWDAIRNPAMRSALYEIWLNRDFTAYGQALGRPITLAEWRPADLMRLYVRKDVAATLWEYATGPVTEEVIADPYENGEVFIAAERTIGSSGSAPGQLNRPRNMAVAPDGSLYVADSDNHRIQHFSSDGTLLRSWGSFADILAGPAPAGSFNQPWGIAVGPDGSVYVADTWNHRIQRFSPEGDFMGMWGTFGQAETPDAFWGPRDVAVDSQGRVFVTDTGNKRISVFTAAGEPLTQFGQFGLEPGGFDEPVGIAFDNQERVYIADTWNQRIQVFQELDGQFFPLRTWDVAGWYGQSLDNKPYIAFEPVSGHILVTDPELARVIEFDDQGAFIRYWGGSGAGLTLAGGIAADGKGGIWVTEVVNGQLLYYRLP
jgi:uncharacterized protein (TIGR03663 family)